MPAPSVPIVPTANMQGTDMLAELPNELILRIFANLDLQGLIAARCINQRWRTLVPCTEMGAIRKAMLDFYDKLLLSPMFHRTRTWVKMSLKPFDRPAYIAKLLRQYPSLPDDFRLWVLEWPENAIIAGLWPGLPRRRYDIVTANSDLLPGVNWLSYPQVSAIIYVDRLNKVAEHIPGIVIWSGPEGVIFLVVDERNSMNGKIFHSGLGSYRAVLDGSLDLDRLHNTYDKLVPSWIAHLQQLWNDVEDMAEGRTRPDRPETDNIAGNISPSPPDVSELAGVAWKRRAEHISLTWLESARVSYLGI